MSPDSIPPASERVVALSQSKKLFQKANTQFVPLLWMRVWDLMWYYLGMQICSMLGSPETRAPSPRSAKQQDRPRPHHVLPHWLRPVKVPQHVTLSSPPSKYCCILTVDAAGRFWRIANVVIHSFRCTICCAMKWFTTKSFFHHNLEHAHSHSMSRLKMSRV